MEITVRIQLCRRLRIEWDGERLDPALPGNQGRLLFAYLVLHRDRPVRRDELLEVLWSGEAAPDAAEALLSAPLSRLRKSLGPGRLEGRGELSLVLPPGAWVDWEAAFDGLRAAHDAPHPRIAWDAARAALEIADGGLLPGLEARWIDAKRTELADLRLELLELVAAAGAQLGGGELPQAEQAARAAVEAAPFRESARAALIEVLRARGNVADALRAFEDARTLLRDELGASPGPRLLALHQRLLHGEPVTTAPDLAASPPALPDRLAAALAAPIIGRAEPLERLQAELGRAREGETPVVLVTGEGGIGKTRLIAEVARRAEGFAVLYGRCDEDQLFPFGPWIEMLGGALAPVPDGELPALLGEDGRELARLLPELRGRVPGLAAPGPSDPESELRHLHTAVVALVRRLAHRRPLLMLIDDLHWADRSSLLLARHVLRTLGVGPVLLLGAYRDTELREFHPLTEVLADLERDRPLPRIALRGLDTRDVEALARARGVPSETARAISAETHGNPFFVEQLLRHIDEAGTARVSAGLRDVIVRRVARLPGQSGPVLRVAALIGRDFDLRLLEPVVDVPADTLLDLLDAAVAAGILVEVASAPGRYSFVHALVRTTLEQELSVTRRARVHLRIGEAIETHQADRLDAWLDQLVRHFAAAGPEASDRAVAYAVRAAEQATARLAYEEAADLLERALAAHDRDDYDGRANLMHDLALARLRLGHVAQSRETFAQAAETARRSDDAELFARAALGHAGGVWQRYGIDDPASAHLLEEALALLPAQDTALRAEVLARLGGVVFFSPARSTSLIEDAVAMARRVGDHLALMTALSAAQFAYWRPDLAPTRLAIAEEVVDVAERLGNPELMAEAVMWRVGALLTLCRLDEADADVARHAALSRRLEQPERQMLSASVRSMRALLEGRWDEAERAVGDVLEVGERFVPMVAQQLHAAAMLQLRGEQLRLGELSERFEELARAISGLPAWRVPLAWSYAQAGRVEAARAELADLRRDDFAALGRDANFDVGLVGLAHVADELGDVELAAQIEPHLRPFAEYWVVLGVGIGTLGPVAYSLGVCSLLTGRIDAAVADFELALAQCERMRARPYAAHASLRLARALSILGDGARAAALERSALAIAHELGMPRLLRDAGTVATRT